MKDKKKVFILSAIVWLFVFCCGMFFTSGVNFFFEDFHFLHLDKEHSLFEVNPQPTLQRTLLAIPKEFFSPKQLLHAGFSATLNDRPFFFLSNDLFSILFKDNLALYRIFRAAILATIGVLIFLIVWPASLFLAFLSVIWFSSSGQVWAVLIGAGDINLYAQLAMITSVAIFLHLLKSNKPGLKRILVSYLMILFISQYAVLSKGDGRYLAAVFFLTLLCFRKQQLRSHLPMLVVLFLAEVPLLGYISKLFFGFPYTPIDIGSHSSTSFGSIVNSVMENYQYPIVALGKLSLMLLALAVFVYLCLLLFRRGKAGFIANGSKFVLLKERTFFFMLYFIFSFIVISVSRNFNYSGFYSLDFSETMCFIVPFLLFLCYYVAFIADYAGGSYRRFFIVITAIFLAAQIVKFELPRLNRFRGAWGNYICSLGNTERYIDKSSGNALVFYLNTMPYKPFVFSGSKNRVIMDNSPADKNPFCDLSYIESKFKEGYADIFVVNSYNELKFRGQSQKIKLVDMTAIDGDCGDFYDRFKHFIRRPSQKIVFVYRFGIK